MLPQANFLVTGHTHIDVDGIFGAFSNFLKRHDVLTDMEMQTLFERAVKLVADEMQNRGFTTVRDDSVNPKARVMLVETVPDFEPIYNSRVGHHILISDIRCLESNVL